MVVVGDDERQRAVVLDEVGLTQLVIQTFILIIHCTASATAISAPHANAFTVGLVAITARQIVTKGTFYVTMATGTERRKKGCRETHPTKCAAVVTPGIRQTA